MKKIFSFISILFLYSTLANCQDLPKGFTPQELEIMPFYMAPSPTKSFLFPPSVPVRAMAEWEELQAISITWKSYQSVLAQIVRHAQNECKVIINCSDSTTVKNYLISQGVTPNSNIEYLIVSTNSVWIRDYGSYSVYKDNVDSLYLIDWIYNRPRPLDDVIPSAHAQLLDLPLYAMTQSPNQLTHTGGNLMIDGFGSAFSSELVLEENAQYGHTNATIDTIMQHYMGINRYIKFEVLPYDGIHHIDMHMKMLDEETILVGECPDGISDGPQIEANLLYLLNNFNSVFGTPYRIVRIPLLPNPAGNSWPSSGSYFRTYTNGVFINKSFIYPSYYEKYDTTAFRIFKEALPGYNIVPINCDPDPISASGAIHCITNNIGVENPLLISHKRLEDTYNSSVDYVVNALIKHKTGISNAKVYYRTDTLMPYASVNMALSGGIDDHWIATIPAKSQGTTVYYYIEANANSGKSITRPLTAPSGYWKFSVLSPSNLCDKEASVRIEKVFPNPASAITCIQLDVIVNESVKIEMYDINGRFVTSIFEGKINQGKRNFFFNAANFNNGIYFIKVQSSNHVSTQKVLIQK